MPEQAKEEMDSELRYVLFDSWYISLDNLKAIRSSSTYTVVRFISTTKKQKAGATRRRPRVPPPKRRG